MCFFEYTAEERGWTIKVLELSVNINIWRAALRQKFVFNSERAIWEAWTAFTCKCSLKIKIDIARKT